MYQNSITGTIQMWVACDMLVPSCFLLEMIHYCLCLGKLDIREEIIANGL